MYNRLFLLFIGLLCIAGCGGNEPSIENPVTPVNTSSQTVVAAAAEKTNVCHFDQNGGSKVISVNTNALVKILAEGDCVTTAPKGTSNCSCSPASIVSFTASPDTIDLNAGETSTLSWSTADASSCSIDHGIGSVPCNGSKVVSPTLTTVYTLTATGFVGGPDSSQATVNIQYCAALSGTAPSGPLACPTGVTKYCEPVPIDPHSRTQAQSACVACSGTSCSEITDFFGGGKGWFGFNGSVFMYADATQLGDCSPHECFDLAQAGMVIPTCGCWTLATWAFF